METVIDDVEHWTTDSRGLWSQCPVLEPLAMLGVVPLRPSFAYIRRIPSKQTTLQLPSCHPTSDTNEENLSLFTQVKGRVMNYKPESIL